MIFFPIRSILKSQRVNSGPEGTLWGLSYLRMT
nr:MAG TPA: hypothetical protein [Bacteriophage sp.]